jgi:hypothetical protein
LVKLNQKEDDMAKKHDDAWEPEQQFDAAASLEELLHEPPFKEASDESGSSHTAGARVPMWLYRRIIKLREQKGSPYDIDSDVVRDAIFVGLRVLNMRYRVNPDWDVESKMATIVDTASAAKRLKQQVRDLADGLGDLLQDGDTERASQGLIRFVGAAIELENSWQRRRLFGMLRDDKTITEIAKHCDPQIWKTVEREAKANG